MRFGLLIVFIGLLQTETKIDYKRFTNLRTLQVTTVRTNPSQCAVFSLGVALLWLPIQ